VAAGLLGVLVIDVHHRAGDGFAVCHFRFSDVRLHLELPQQTVHQNIQVKFSHAGDNGLTGVFILTNLKSRVFFRQFHQRIRHLFLVCFGFGFNRHGNYRVREADAFQYHRRGGVAERIPGETEL